MASTYVNNLRLNEMATGDGAGTWGTTTNTNLELIGEALGYGTEAITTNADTHTSTVADGSTDAARAMYIKYTGTLDSACTITIGPNTISKMWFIENATTGSQNIIISQGSGANITIPAGDTKAVYSDGAGSGAAFVDAFASLSVVDLKVQDDLTVTDDMTVGGTLGVTGVLTATSLDISGDIDVDGTTNLDVVDIDGAVDMASTLGVTGVLTANAGVVVDNITIDGTQIDLSSGDLTLDVAGDIILDADGGVVYLNDGGVGFGQLVKNSNDFRIFNPISDGDIVFRGNDNGSVISALTLDMSDAGSATFNNNLYIPNAILHSGDTDTYIQFDAANSFKQVTGGVESYNVTASSFTINDGSADLDFRVESNGNTHMLFVDGGNDAVGIGTSTPGAYYSGAEQLVVAKASGEAGITIATASDTNGALYFADGTTGAEAYQGGIGYQHDTSKLFLVESGVATMFFGPTEYVFNETSLDRDFRVESNNNANMLFVDGGANHVNIGTSTDYGGVLNVESPDNGATLILVSTDADASEGPLLDLRRESASPADDDLIGSIRARGNNDAAQNVTYTQVKNYILDASDGTEDGQYNIETIVAGSLQTRMLINNTGVVFNESSIDSDFRVESNGSTHMLFVDGGNNEIGIGTNAPDAILHVHKATAGSVTALSDSTLVLENSTHNYLTFLSPNDKEQAIIFGDAQNNNSASVGYNHNTDNLSISSVDDIVFNTSGTTRGRFTDNGLCFNADTAAGNALDDYEEGTWTPSIVTGTASFGSSSYTKVGRLVNCFTQVGSFSDTSSGNAVAIGSLPFIAIASDKATTLGSLAQHIGTGFGTITGAYLESSTSLRLYNTSASGFRYLKHSDLNGSSSLYIAFTYMSE